MVRPVLFAFCLLFLPGVSGAEERVALVVGNSRYETVPSLTNPRHDAEDIAAALQRLGFGVTREFDLDARSMSIALRNFSRAAAEAETAVIYFAGHGMEIDNINYLLPVDAVLERSTDVAFEATDMDKFMRSAGGAKKLRLVLLDACRDNPFLARFTDVASRSTRRGLGVVEPGAGVLVGFSARGGTVALDGEGRNSPYAEALLAHLEEPGLEIGQLFRRVRDSVLQTTGGQQEPFTYGSLPAGDIFLRAPEPTGPSAREVLRAYLDADAEGTPAGWRAFLDTYEGTDVSPDLMVTAKRKLERLTQRLQAQVNVPQTPPRFEARHPDDDPMIRACDQLAADPEDPARPEGVAGVEMAAINTTAAVTACTLASAGYPDHGRSYFQLARAHMASENSAAAGPALRRSAQLGYSAAGVQLGAELLKVGKTESEIRDGHDMLVAASDAGSSLAARMLGDYFSNPVSFFTQRGEPLRYYRLAAERGDVPSMYEAGYRMISGNLSDKNQVREGLQYLESAASKGHQPSIRRLANFHLFSFKSNPLRSPEKGIRWLKQSAESGSSKAAKQMAALYQSGTTVPRDIVQAAQWTELAALQGDQFAMVENAYNWETGRGKSRLPSMAAQNYYHALQKGNVMPYRRITGEWDRETARSLQELLRMSGKARYRGPSDGLVGAGTRAAMARLCECKPAPASISLAKRFGE